MYVFGGVKLNRNKWIIKYLYILKFLELCLKANLILVLLCVCILIYCMSFEMIVNDIVIDVVIAWTGYDKPKLKTKHETIKVFLYTEISWIY